MAAQKPTVGILALQGAFREHGQALSALGAGIRELRQKKHLPGIDALVIPGGESSTMGKLLCDLDMLEDVRAMIAGGMPVYGSCAGLILLSREIEDSDQPRLGALDASVRRNAFGRQVDSFESDLVVKGLDAPFHAVFIRAPVLTRVGPDVDVLASVSLDGCERPVAVRQGNILGTAFHPELTGDTRMHRLFLDMLK